MATRSEKLRRRQHRKDKKRQRAAKTNYIIESSDELLVIEPPGEAKMSEALIELVELQWNTCVDEADMRKMLLLGMTAWNIALMSSEKRAEVQEKLTNKFPDDVRKDLELLLEPLIRRKEQLFPHIHRPMLDFKLTWLPSGKPYLLVMSGLG